MLFSLCRTAAPKPNALEPDTGEKLTPLGRIHISWKMIYTALALVLRNGFGFPVHVAVPTFGRPALGTGNTTET
ncbi:hypothetical protein NKJ40_09960 [Mesorhizobium sp. M0119]|uniref:hypothetical protein n=1 Tax=unclassified Mesorhizobium TaxID=325217 RepID=UPI0033370723